MKPFRILDEALVELEEAATWYEEQHKGLGLELTTEFRGRIELAVDQPGTGARAGETPGGNQIRRFRLRRFKR